MLDLERIKALIPHRPPFLLLDGILELEPGRRAVGVKNVTANEFFFPGHFPDYPVMPGVLIVEALAQVAAVAVLSLEPYRGRIPLFAGIDKARFKRQVVPGDTLRLDVEILKMKASVGKAAGRAWVGKELAAEAELIFAAGGKIPAGKGFE
ncbi:MAG: 3-hydroxyacyl-ACP dehydratase FabZ [Bacillota bacterium]